MTAYRLVVHSNAVAGREDEFDAWYVGRHLDDVLAIPGFVRAERLLVERSLTGEAPPHRHLAIYEFESDDLDATLGHFFARTGTDLMPISDTVAPGAVPLVYRLTEQRG